MIKGIPNRKASIRLLILPGMERTVVAAMAVRKLSKYDGKESYLKSANRWGINNTVPDDERSLTAGNRPAVLTVLPGSGMHSNAFK